LTNVGGTLFFAANDGTNGKDLWKSDGTAAGTVVVTDIQLGGAYSYSSHSTLTNVGGTLFFAARDGTHGKELWKSDGTAAGTVLVTDIQPGSAGSYPAALTNVGGTLFFSAADDTHGDELWKLATSPNQPPAVAKAASATPSPVTGTTTSLSVLGKDDGGEANLTYTWATTGTPPAAVSFTANGSNAAKNTTATFTRAGSYAFQVTITDSGGLSTTSKVTVTVKSVLSSIAVSPQAPQVVHGTTQQFKATAKDQFGVALAKQPKFTWQTTVGKITATGLLTAPGGPATGSVTASSGKIKGSSNVSVVNQSSPVLGSIETQSLYYQPKNPAPVTSAITAGDSDGTNLTGATITISANYKKGADVLAFKNTKTIVGKWNSTTGVLTLSGSDSVANYQAALRAVTYQNTSATASTAARTVTFQISDGSAVSNSLSRSIVFSASGAAATLPGGRIADLAGLIAAPAACGAASPSTVQQAKRTLFAEVANWFEPSV
jgi:ELWxxDGT repeat protein